MKKIFTLVFIAFSLSFSLFAQNADIVSKIIDSDNVVFADASYICAVQMGSAEESADSNEVHEAFEKELFGEVKHNAQSPVLLSDAAFMIAKAWNVKSSLMFRVFNNKRYAFSMLKADGIIDINADPSKKISGHEFLNMISACIDKYGE